MNQNDPRRQNDEGRGRPDGNRPPPPPQDGQQLGCIVGSPGCQLPR
jgi:hypothetical protein